MVTPKDVDTVIESLSKINTSTIIPFEDNYLINNKYNIEKTKLDSKLLNKIENNIKTESIAEYNKFKNSTIAFITAVLSILSSLLYLSIKKVISKK